MDTFGYVWIHLETSDTFRDIWIHLGLTDKSSKQIDEQICHWRFSKRSYCSDQVSCEPLGCGTQSSARGPVVKYIYRIQIEATSLWECTTECEAGWSLLFRDQEEHGGRGRRVDVVRGQELLERNLATSIKDSKLHTFGLD